MKDWNKKTETHVRLSMKPAKNWRVDVSSYDDCWPPRATIWLYLEVSDKNKAEHTYKDSCVSFAHVDRPIVTWSQVMFTDEASLMAITESLTTDFIESLGLDKENEET